MRGGGSGGGVCALLQRLRVLCPLVRRRTHPPPLPSTHSADGALAHPYFDSVRSQYTFEDPVLATGPGCFEFAFESAKELTVPDFRRLIVEEAASFRAERLLTRRLREESAAASGSGGAGGSAGDSGQGGMDVVVSRPSSAALAAGGITKGPAVTVAAGHAPGHAPHAGAHGALPPRGR